MMDYVCVGLFFFAAGMLAWNLYLHEQIRQRQGSLERTQAEIDWVARNCPNEWARIGAAMMRRDTHVR